MKRFFWFVVFLLAGAPQAVLGAPVAPETALQAASAWLGLDAHALAPPRVGIAAGIAAQADAAGKTLYYTVPLSPEGFILVGGDDTFEPILAFSGTGSFDGNSQSPLYSLATTDAAARLGTPRQGAADAATVSAAREKWNLLLGSAGRQGSLARQSKQDIASVLVAPLLATQWGQDNDAAGNPTYNLYTPTTTGGVHTLTGCVATAMAQVMRYYAHPTTAVGTTSRPIKVCQLCQGSTPSECAVTTMATRGGDGAGGAYAFEAMTLVPDANTPTASRQAIAALMADAGSAVRMD